MERSHLSVKNKKNTGFIDTTKKHLAWKNMKGIQLLLMRYFMCIVKRKQI